MTIDGGEFVRRFLLHVLPRGLMRGRDDGFLAKRCRRTRLAQIRAVLAVKTAADYACRATDATTRAECTCPRCRSGPVHSIELITPSHAGSTPRATGNTRTDNAAGLRAGAPAC
ncbi:transposase [Aquisalimonas sp.]|uniref:transposase n=1 Tax=Aquisalimonas sp. TaxID=1872621 RepID=UPI003454125E